MPDGLVVELSRGRLLASASAEADRWMQMLNDREDECIACLDRERMAIEIVFRFPGDEHLYWVSVHGPNDGELDLGRAIDRDHLELAKGTKEPGWVEAQPQLLLMPEPVRAAVLGWALRPEPTGPTAR